MPLLSRTRADAIDGGSVHAIAVEADEADRTETAARPPIWPIAVLMAGGLLTGLWVLLLGWSAYHGLLWLLGTA